MPSIHSMGKSLAFITIYITVLGMLRAKAIANRGALAQCRTWCGNQSIGYPFGLEEGCGRPEFRLNCNQKDKTIELRLNSKIFTVTKVDYINSKIFVRDSKMSDCSGLRQEDPNFRLDLRGTNYKFTESSVLLLNCLAFRKEIQVTPFNSEYDCKSPACMAFLTSCIVDTIGDGVPPTCCEVTFPGSLDLHPLLCQSYTSVYNIGGSMFDANMWNYGLVLDWYYPLQDLHACMDCQRTGGVCGYNVSELQNDFFCICEKGNSSRLCQEIAERFNGSCSHDQLEPHSTTLKHKGGRNTYALKALAIALAILATLLGTFLLCICCLRNKKRVRIEAAETETEAGCRSSSCGSLTKEEANNQPLPIILQHIDGSSSSSMILYSYDELKDATELFSESRLLGDGGYGMVYLAKFCDGRVAAVKTLNYQNQRRVEQFHNEVRILGKVRHPNLVQLLGFCLEGRDLILVYELLSNGTLQDHILQNGDNPRWPLLPWTSRLSIAIQVADALSYLHNSVTPPIFHRDVKSTNILLDHAFHAKLADFGLSRLAPTEASHVSTAPQGTLGYLDPEYHQTFRLTDKSDVYSFGVVLMEIIASRRVVDPSKPLDEINLCALALSKMHKGMLRDIVDPLFLNLDVILSVEMVADVAMRCLASCRNQRPTMNQVLAQLEQIRDAA